MYFFIKDFVIRLLLASYAYVCYIAIVQIYLAYYGLFDPSCGSECAGYALIFTPAFASIAAIISLVIENAILHVKFTYVELLTNYVVSILISALALIISVESF